MKGRPPSSGRIEKAAETVGGALGSVMAKVDAWMAQREEIAKELRAAADRIMSGDNPFSGKAAFRVPGGSTRPAARPKKRPTMSKVAREKIAAAQRARWAKQKAEAASGTDTAPAAAKKASKKSAKR